MIKNFTKWNNEKKKIEQIDRDVLFKTGDVWRCSVGVNIQSESCGKGDNFRRPVLILKKLSRKIFIGIPLSSKNKKGTWFFDIEIEGIKRCALLYQLRMFHLNRLQRRIAILNLNDFDEIKRKLETLLELHNYH